MNLNKIPCSDPELLHRVVVNADFALPNIALPGVSNSQRGFSTTHTLILSESIRIRADQTESPATFPDLPRHRKGEHGIVEVKTGKARYRKNEDAGWLSFGMGCEKPTRFTVDRIYEHFSF
jgi:hypothetical protein